MIPNHYIFVAEYDDGQTYHQGPHDVSRQNPMKSAFYDIRVSPLIPEERLVKFGLIRTRLPLVVATVDLRTGRFEINRAPVPVPMEAPRKREAPLRLLYEKQNELEMCGAPPRTHRSVLNTGFESRHKVTYRMGWECDGEWLALDLDTASDKITLRGSHERAGKPELAAALIG